MVVFTTIWGLSALAYLGMAGQVSVAEIGLAFACGLIAAFWAIALETVAEIHLRFETAAGAAAVRALANLPGAIAKATVALVSRRGGAVVRQQFIRGREQMPADAARRATALLAMSLAPDKFVLRIPLGRDEIELHTLVTNSAVANSTSADLRWPV